MNVEKKRKKKKKASERKGWRDEVKGRNNVLLEKEVIL